MKKMFWLLMFILLLQVATCSAQEYATAHPTEAADLFYYSKDGNIWSHNHANGEIRQLTDDGEIDPTSYRGGYYAPISAQSGAFLAYESSTSFYVYTSVDQSTIRIDKAAQPDIAADALLGWDDQDQLYFTLTYGNCIADQYELSGPDAVIVYRYNPASQQVEALAALPIPVEPDHAYVIGLDISPDGKIVRYQPVLCYAGIGDAVQEFDLSTGREVPVSKSADQLPIRVDPGWIRTSRLESSPKGQTVAYLVQKGFEDGGFFIPADESGASLPRLMLAPMEQLSNIQYYEANIAELGKWSNDGQRIYFSVAPDASEWANYRWLDYLDLTTGEVVTIDEGDLIGF